MQVQGGDPASAMRVDAAVNCGNTLASLAQVHAWRGQPQGAGSSLVDAESCYQLALRQEDDALVRAGFRDWAACTILLRLPDDELSLKGFVLCWWRQQLLCAPQGDHPT